MACFCFVLSHWRLSVEASRGRPPSKGDGYEAASLPGLALDSVLVLVFLAGAVFAGAASLLSLGDELAESGEEGGESDVSAVAELRPRLSVT